MRVCRRLFDDSDSGHRWRGGEVAIISLSEASSCGGFGEAESFNSEEPGRGSFSPGARHSRIQFDTLISYPVLQGDSPENPIRPTKLGHKNWMFIDGEHTDWRSAVIYTFVEKIRMYGADPFAYFEWVFEKLMHNPTAEELESLLPVHWLRARAEESYPIDVETEAIA